MKRRFRYYFPIIRGEHLQALIVLLCVIDALINYFSGNTDKATFWMIVAMFNYIAHKL